VVITDPSSNLTTNTWTYENRLRTVTLATAGTTLLYQLGQRGQPPDHGARHRLAGHRCTPCWPSIVIRGV